MVRDQNVQYRFEHCIRCSWKDNACIRTLTMWLAALLVPVFTWLLWKCLKGSRCKRNEPPGPLGLPIMGYLPFLDFKRPNLTFLELAKRYGDVFQLRMGSTKVVVVNGQRAVRQLYKSTDFLGRPDWATHRIFTATQDNFLFTPFSLHYWIHKKLLVKAMNRFLAERSQETEEAVHKIVRMAVDEAKKRNRQPFDPGTICKQVGCVLTFYHAYERLPRIQDEEVQEAAKITYDSLDVSKAVSILNSLPWMRFSPTVWKPLSTCRTTFRQYREYQDKLAAVSIDKYDGKIRRCLVDYLCHEAAQLDDDDSSILTVNDDFIKKTSTNISFFGCVASLTAAIKWIIFLSALHPNVQNRVRDEINQKIGKARQPRFQDANILPYTTATLKEICRYVSMAVLTPFKSTTCDTELDGYFIPKGTAVAVNLYSANRDGTVFPNPDTFDPQRFLNPDGTLNADAYNDVIDSGLGPRRCGGGQLWWLEVFTFFASMVQCCHIEQAPGCPLDPTDYYFEVGAIPSPFKVVIH